LIGSDIAKRYTRALFDIAQKEDKIEVIYNELKGFSSIFEGKPGFGRIFCQSSIRHL